MWWVPWAKKSLGSKVCHAHMVKDGVWGKNSMVCRSEVGTAPSSSHNCAWVLRKEDEWIPGREDLGITRSLVLVMEETMNHRMGQSGNFLSAWNISGLQALRLWRVGHYFGCSWVSFWSTGRVPPSRGRVDGRPQMASEAADMKEERSLDRKPQVCNKWGCKEKLGRGIVGAGGVVHPWWGKCIHWG